MHEENLTASSGWTRLTRAGADSIMQQNTDDELNMSTSIQPRVKIKSPQARNQLSVCQS